MEILGLDIDDLQLVVITVVAVPIILLIASLIIKP